MQLYTIDSLGKTKKKGKFKKVLSQSSKVKEGCGSLLSCGCDLVHENVWRICDFIVRYKKISTKNDSYKVQ